MHCFCSSTFYVIFIELGLFGYLSSLLSNFPRDIMTTTKTIVVGKSEQLHLCKTS